MNLGDISAGTLLTLAGAILIAGIAGLWLKRYLNDWRFTPLVVLAATIGAMTVLTLAIRGLSPPPEEWATMAVLAVVGATIETFGYETVTNILGRYGVGNRSDAALQRQALDLLHESGYEIKPARK